MLHMISVMTPFPHTVEISAPLSEAKAMLYGLGVRHLPVLSAGKLIGLISDRDVKLVMAITKNEKEQEKLRVEDACTFDAYIVDIEDRLDKVLEFMVANRIGSALVTRNTKLVGIFTTTDACRLYSELLKEKYPDA